MNPLKQQLLKYLTCFFFVRLKMFRNSALELISMCLYFKKNKIKDPVLFIFLIGEAKCAKIFVNIFTYIYVSKIMFKLHITV